MITTVSLHGQQRLAPELYRGIVRIASMVLGVENFEDLVVTGLVVDLGLKDVEDIVVPINQKLGIGVGLHDFLGLGNDALECASMN